MADIEIAHTDEVVGELASQLVARDVLDFEPLQVKDVRNRKTRQPIELFGVLDQILSEAKLMVALDPSDAGARQAAPEGPQDASAMFDLAPKLLPTARRVVVA